MLHWSATRLEARSARCLQGFGLRTDQRIEDRVERVATRGEPSSRLAAKRNQHRALPLAKAGEERGPLRNRAEVKAALRACIARVFPPRLGRQADDCRVRVAAHYPGPRVVVDLERINDLVLPA